MLTCHHGYRKNTAYREEETRERLSSLIRQNGLTGGTDADCYGWVLLAEWSRDRFVILEGIRESCCLAAHNDDFQLVAVGSVAASEDDGCAVFWPEAKDLAFVLHRIMRKKRNAANDSEGILQESAIRGLVFYHLVGCEARWFTTAEDDEFWASIPRSSVASSSLIPSLELEMQMLARLLKPPSVLAAASSSLLTRCHLNNTANALVTIGMDNNPYKAAGYELPELPVIMATAGDGNGILGHSLLDLMHGFVTRSSGGRGRNSGGGGIPPALIEFLIRHWRHDYGLEAQRPLQIFLANTNLEAGGQAHRVSHLLPAAAAAPVQEPPEVTKMIKVVMLQAFAAFLPACVTAYPQVKDAPDHVKFTIFGGLGFITVGLFVGLLSKSVAHRRLAFQIVSFLAIAVLAFSVASQFSSPTYISFTALVGVALNLIIMLLPFYTK